MKNIYPCLLLLTAFYFYPSIIKGASTGSASVSLRPSHVYIKSDTSQSAVLVTLSNYSTNDVRYRLFNGSNQYACWSSATNSFISSASYSAGPRVTGDLTGSSSLWIVYQRGANNSNTASYRDRIGPAYSVNNNTIALPSAVSIADSFIVSGKLTGSGVNTLSEKYVVLAWNQTTLISATSSSLNSGSFSIYLPAGISVDKIEVRTLYNLSIAELNGSWNSFTNLQSITLTDISVQNSKLQSIKLDNRDLPGFNPNIKNYNIELPGGTILIPVLDAVADSPGSAITISQAIDLNGDEAARTATILVTAEDGYKISSYKILFSRSLPGKDAFLLNLAVNGGDIAGFTPGILIYSVPVVCGTSPIPSVSYIKSDSNAVAKITDATNLYGTIDERTTLIPVTAADGITTKTYKVIFETYVPGRNSSLIELSVNGNPITDFDPGILEYNYTLPAGTTIIPSIGFIAADEKASGVVSQASNISGSMEERTASVLVTAEDGISTSRYRIVFSVYLPGNNASLMNISVNDSTIANFSPSTFTYEVLLSKGTIAVPAITYKKADEKAVSYLTNASKLDGSENERTAIIQVSSEDQVNTLSYKIVFSVYIPGTDAFLSDISVNGSTLENFHPGTFNYAVSLPFKTSVVPEVTFAASDPKASVSVTSAINLHGSEEDRTTKILVTAEDRVSVNSYNLLFSLKMPGTDALLSYLSVDGTKVSGFNSLKFNYIFQLPKEKTTVPVVNFTTSDPVATAVLMNASNIIGTEAERTTTVEVTAEDEISKSSYKLVFEAYKPDTLSFLSGLSVNNIVIAGFLPDSFVYEVLLPAGTTTVPNLSCKTMSENASFAISDAAGLTGNEADRTSTVRVVAEDGVTISVYRVLFSVYIPGSNAFLSGLSVNCSVIAGFAPDILEYNVVLPSGTTRFPAISYTTADAMATSEVKNATNVSGTPEERTTEITVTAENGTTRLIYKIIFIPDENSGYTNTQGTGISLYPNPALGLLTIRGLNGVRHLDILSAKGKVVRKIEIMGDEMTIGISDLQNGMYFLRTESQTLKFIKE